MTEPGAGSDVAGMRTKAEDKGDHYLLNGSKTYISNGILADLVVVAAKTDPGKSHGLSLFVVERGMEGFERGRNLKKMGLKSQDTAELFFNNVKVPKENLLGEWNKGFYHLMHFLAEERLLGAVGYLAAAECGVRHHDGLHHGAQGVRPDASPISRTRGSRWPTCEQKLTSPRRLLTSV